MNNFLKRVVALIIDLFILSCVCNLFGIVTIKSDTYISLDKEAASIQENYDKGKIDSEAYINQVSDICYDMLRGTGLYMIISIAIYLLYFGYYQYKRGGQTIGKKLLHIKVKGKDRDLSINDYVYRSLIINGILFNFIIVLLLFFGSKQIFMLLYSLIMLLYYVIMIICGLMVLIRKDHRGLHDFIGHSEVVNE